MMYTINLIPRMTVTVIPVSQEDTSLRRFQFRLQYDGADYVLTDETVELIMSNGATHPCTIEDGMAVLDAYADMTAEPGRFRSKLKIVDAGGGILFSAAFIIQIEEGA